MVRWLVMAGPRHVMAQQNHVMRLRWHVVAGQRLVMDQPSQVMTLRWHVMVGQRHVMAQPSQVLNLRWQVMAGQRLVMAQPSQVLTLRWQVMAGQRHVMAHTEPGDDVTLARDGRTAHPLAPVFPFPWRVCQACGWPCVSKPSTRAFTPLQAHSSSKTQRLPMQKPRQSCRGFCHCEPRLCGAWQRHRTRAIERCSTPFRTINIRSRYIHLLQSLLASETLGYRSP